MPYKHLLLKSDGSRQNLFTAKGLDVDSLKKVWMQTFPKGFNLTDFSAARSTRSPVTVITPVGPVGTTLKIALTKGPEWLIGKAHGFQQPGKVSIAATIAKIETKFTGLKIKEWRRDSDGSTHFFCVHGKRSIWLSRGILRQRSLIDSLFDKEDSLRKKDTRARTTHAIEAEAFLQRKLAALGLSSIVRVCGYDMTTKVVSLEYEGAKVPVNIWYLRNSTPNKRSLLLRLTTWTRFGLTTPVKYSDDEWAQKIIAYSKGRVRPAAGGYVPPKQRPDKGHAMVCVRCSHQFYAPTLFNKPGYELKCPECDRQQSKSYSKQALRWLADIECRFDVKLRTAISKNGEHQLTIDNAKTFVDGYHAKTKTVFEFHGSRWHGNPTIFYPNDTPSPYSSKKAYQLLLSTVKRELTIMESGYNLIRIWDHDFLNPERYPQWLLRNTPRIKKALTLR